MYMTNAILWLVDLDFIGYNSNILYDATNN